MKKRFEKPVLYRYEINVREEIVGSTPHWWDGSAVVSFYFVYLDNSSQNEITQDEGCFDYLNREYSTAGNMTSFNAFDDWQLAIAKAQHGGDWNNPLVDLAAYNEEHSTNYTRYIEQCRIKDS